MDQINFQPVINAFITLLGLVITCVLVPYIKNKVSDQQYQKLLEAIRIAVSAAEQLFPDAKSGSEKKQYVLDLLEDQGFDISKKSVDAMVESTVQLMYNHEY